MSQAYQDNSSSASRVSSSTAQPTQFDDDPSRTNQLASLTPSERMLLQVNTERLQLLIEAFCERMSTLVVRPITNLTSRPNISIKDLTQCWLSCWTTHRDLFNEFHDGMRFYREVDPKGVGAYYLELKDEIDTCIKNLSDVALSEKSDWPSLLQQIAHRMQVALSMDVNGITGIIRADLKTLGKLNSDSPEGP